MLDGHLTRLQRIRLLHQLGNVDQRVPHRHTWQSVGSQQAGPQTCGIPTQGITIATAVQYREGAGAYLGSADAVLLVQLGSGEVNMHEVRVEAGLICGALQALSMSAF